VNPIAHGFDLVEIDRLQHSIERFGERFLARVFTRHEREYCQSQKRCFEHYAARFAAKEAVMKALGTGWRHGLAWTDIEVCSAPSGQPSIRLHRVAADRAKHLAITAWLVSLSHTKRHAAASVIALSA
jgi:holo-[acyl-carrier protein] synthase